MADDPVDQGLVRSALGFGGRSGVAHCRGKVVAQGFDRGRERRPIVVGRYLGADFQMMDAQRRCLARRFSPIAALQDGCGHSQQAVGDPAQGGHHHRPVRGRALEPPAHDPGGGLEPACIGHRGAAELEDLHGGLPEYSRVDEGAGPRRAQ